MSNSDNKASMRPKARGSRTTPVIELAASEIIEPVAAQAASTATETLISNADSASIRTESETPDTKDEAKVEAASETTVTAPEKPAKPSLFLPMTFAALLGGVLGTAGGAFLPSILGFGSSTANPEVQQLKQQVSTLANKPVPVSPELETMRTRIQALEGDIAKRLTDAENKLSSRLQGLEGDVKTLASRPAGPVATPVDLSPLTQRLGALEKDIKTVETKTEAGLKAADPKIAAIAQQVDAAAKRMTASSAAPFFASVQGLAQAFNAGVSFNTELTAVELLGGKAEELASLRPLAEKGAPTLAQITARFASLAGKLAQGELKSDNFALSFLEKFAKVRPVGQVGGTTPADIVSTIEAALSKGDVTSALTSWRRLPEPARLSSQEWANNAEARDKAAKVISSMQEAAIAAIRMAKP